MNIIDEGAPYHVEVHLVGEGDGSRGKAKVFDDFYWNSPLNSAYDYLDELPAGTLVHILVDPRRFPELETNA